MSKIKKFIKLQKAPFITTYADGRSDTENTELTITIKLNDVDTDKPKLSISGTSSEYAGQLVDHIDINKINDILYKFNIKNDVEYINEFNLNYKDTIDYYKKLQQLAEIVPIWKRWHLNDINAGCEHQRELWKDQLNESVSIYTHRMIQDTMKQQNSLNVRIKKELDETHKVNPLTEDEIELYELKFEYKSTSNIPKDGYMLHKESKEKRSFIRYEPWVSKTGYVLSEGFPDVGLLLKPCDVCNYKYGSSWIYEKLPDTVIEYIQNM